MFQQHNAVVVYHASIMLVSYWYKIKPTEGTTMSVCALVAASECNEEHFKTLFDAGFFDEVYAVDAGFVYTKACGCDPDLIIGDFDSLGYVPDAQRTAEYPCDKDETDLELAFDRARMRRFDTIYVYGALGGRIDMTLATMQTIVRYAQLGITVHVIGLTEQLDVVIGPDALELPAHKDGIVSVFSASDVCEGVIERGLKYAFNDERITNTTVRGISNEMTGSPAVIGLEKGVLWVFHPIDMPELPCIPHTD